jgi:hypothetical protein
MVWGMKKPKPGGSPATKTPPPGGRSKWMTELPAQTIVQLKVRAALEQRPMWAVLQTAIDAYLATEVAR